MKIVDEQLALAYDPFAGDESEVKVLSDKFVTAAKEHPHCAICHGAIAKGERHRCRSEINRDDKVMQSFRFCARCCAAMCDDTGDDLLERELLGDERRVEE